MNALDNIPDEILSKVDIDLAKLLVYMKYKDRLPLVLEDRYHSESYENILTINYGDRRKVMELSGDGVDNIGKILASLPTDGLDLITFRNRHLLWR